MNKTFTRNGERVTAAEIDCTPYENEWDQAIFRARAIYKNNRRQLIVWAAIYMALLYGLYVLCMLILSQEGKMAAAAVRLALLPLLIGMYAWLHRILFRQPRAYAGLIGPFRCTTWRRFLQILIMSLTVICAAFLQQRLTNAVVGLIQNDSFGPLLETRLFLYGLDPVTTTDLMMFPVVHVPVFMGLQWILDYFCIFAVQTNGVKARDATFFSATHRDFMRLELRLMARTLWIPYTLYYGLTFLLQWFLKSLAFLPVLTYLTSFLFLGFGFAYYPLSAIARSLLVMNRTWIASGAADPLGFGEADAAYAAYQKEREEYRRAKDEEKARQKAEEEADEDGEA